MKLNDIRTPQKLNLEVRLENSDIVNDWDFWVYPDKVKLTQGHSEKYLSYVAGAS